jgi:hypothetical protein
MSTITGGNFMKTFNKLTIAISLSVILGTTTLCAGDKIDALETPSAVSTFESTGITCPFKGDDNKNAVCNVKYRVKGGKAWKEGFPLWRDDKRKEFRGSLVHLSPDTSYDVRLEPQDPDGAPAPKSLTVKTWSENFPIAKTITIPAGSKTFNITESGTPKGYVLYTAPKGKNILDVKNKEEFCININASYVIIRGMVLKGATEHIINIIAGHDIVIENSEFTQWGSDAGDGFAKHMCSAIYANTQSLKRVIIQRNTIHDPLYGANNWTQSRPGKRTNHPLGPQAISFWNSEGNHVFRYNHVYSSPGHYYNDIFGCGANASLRGFPNANTDIYGNILEGSWDEAIETEGANNNVRVWGNYVENAYKAHATRVTSIGPLYIWRNICIMGYRSPGDQISAAFHKSGGRDGHWDNGVFTFHNTAVMPRGKKVAGSGTRGVEGAMRYTTTANNILNVEKSIISELKKKIGNRFLNDLCSGKNTRVELALEATPIKGSPKFTSKFGLNRKTGKGIFCQTPDSPGYNRGIKLPNFNSDVPDGKPDLGAHEAGTPPMEFGPKAYLTK